MFAFLSSKIEMYPRLLWPPLWVLIGHIFFHIKRFSLLARFRLFVPAVFTFFSLCFSYFLCILLFALRSLSHCFFALSSLSRLFHTRVLFFIFFVVLSSRSFIFLLRVSSLFYVFIFLIYFARYAAARTLKMRKREASLFSAWLQLSMLSQNLRFVNFV